MSDLLNGKSRKASAHFLRLLYQSVRWANVADNARDGPLGNIYYGLHKLGLGSNLDQNTSEADYESYARQAVVRSVHGHIAKDNVITLAAPLSFPRATNSNGAEQEAFYFHSGASSVGKGEVFHFGPLDPPILIRRGVTPQLLAETSIEEY